MIEKQLIKNIFPLISYEELDGENWKKTYKRIVISLYNRVLREDEYEKEHSNLVNQYGLKALYQRLINLLLSFEKNSNVVMVDVIGFNDSGSEKIQLREIRLEEFETNILNSLMEEKRVKILFPNVGILFESAFDLSAVLYVNEKHCNFELLNKLIAQQNLNVL